MGILAKLWPLLPALVATSLSGQALAAPFTINRPTSGILFSRQASSCADYNQQVSSGGLNGNPNVCQVSTAQFGLNGLILADFWQAVTTGKMAPPWQVSYASAGRRGVCATATGLKFEVSINVRTSRLEWSGAGAIGPACLAEWNRHSPASLANTSPPAGALQSLQKLVNYLNRNAPASFQSCAYLRRPVQSLEEQAFAGVAARIKQYIADGISRYPLSWSPPQASGISCLVRCNLCLAGWAGTITLTKAFTANGQNYFTETDTLYVGGPPANGNRFPAEWVAVGSGTYRGTNSTLQWQLNADVPGQCNPLTNAVCVQAFAQPNFIEFTEPNSAFAVPNAYQYTQTPAGGQGVTSQAPASETQINSIAPHISTASPGATTADGTKTEMSCPERPPQNPGTYSCTQTWEWHLAEQ